MKTPEETKKGLHACPDELCHICPYEPVGNCMEICMEDAFAYIQKLESRLAKVERERDAAVKCIAQVCKAITKPVSRISDTNNNLMKAKRIVWSWLDNWSGVFPENSKEGTNEN